MTSCNVIITEKSGRDETRDCNTTKSLRKWHLNGVFPLVVAKQIFASCSPTAPATRMPKVWLGLHYMRSETNSVRGLDV